MKDESQHRLLATAQRAGKEPVARPLLVHLPGIEVDALLDIVVRVKTGLAGTGSEVRVVLPDDFPYSEIFVGTAIVVAPNRVRLRFTNIGMRDSRPMDVWVRLAPYEKEKSTLPGVVLPDFSFLEEE